MSMRRWNSLKDPVTAETIRRLLAKVAVHDTTGCWLWTGGRDKGGYAEASVDSRKTRAYRVFYVFFRGPIPEGRVMDHVVCDNGPGGCASPWHVEPATSGENTLRGSNPPAMNARKTACPLGHPYDFVHHNGGRGCRACHTALLRSYYPALFAKRRLRRAIEGKGRAHGSRHGKSKLTEENALAILRLKGQQSQAQIGRHFGVNQRTVSAIHRRESWRHVEMQSAR